MHRWIILLVLFCTVLTVAVPLTVAVDDGADSINNDNGKLWGENSCDKKKLRKR
jgi:hypothetical protein